MTWIARAENGNERECESRAKAEEVKSDMEDLGMDVEIIAPDQAPFGYCEECGESIGHGAPSGSDRCRDCIKGPGTKCEKCGTDIPADAPEEATLCEHHGSWALATPPETDGGAQTAADAIESAKMESAPPKRPDARETDVRATEVVNSPEQLAQDPIAWLRSHNSAFINTIKGTPAISKQGFRFIQAQFGISTESEVVQWVDDPLGCVVWAKAELPDGQSAEAHGEGYQFESGVSDNEFARYADSRAKNRAISDLTAAGALAVTELSED